MINSSSIIGIGLLFIIVIMGFLITAYVIQGLALSTIAKLEGESEILAWIPIANVYLLFRLTDTIPYLVLILLASGIGGTIGTIISSAFAIFVLFKWAKLCERYGIDTTLIYFGIIIAPLALVPMFNLYKEAKSRLRY